MKTVAFLTLTLLASIPAFAQAGDAAVARLAPLYTIDLTHGDWQHEQANICPAFTRHSFVFYHRTASPGVRTSFMAVSSHADGKVAIIPITGAVTRKPIPAVDNPITIAAFNAIWSDELQHSPTPYTLPGLTWGAFAQCYASMAGETPVSVPVDPTIVPDPPFNLKTARVSNMQIPIATSTPGILSQSVSLSLDESGLVRDAKLGRIGPLVAGPTEKNRRPITTGPTEQNPRPILTRQN